MSATEGIATAREALAQGVARKTMPIVSQVDGYGDRSWWALNELGEKYHAAGPDDSGIRWSTYPTGYDSRCASCWLNHSHTQDKHHQSIARHEAQS